MKQLILMRHAKSSSNDSSLPDFDRPLAPRGERDAPRMGQRLESHGVRRTLLLTSPAKRARHTARHVAHELGDAVEQRRDDRLYLASPETLLAVVADQSDANSSLLIVGHNPGLTELANAIVQDFELDNLPTGGVVAIDLDIASWSEIRGARGRLAYYDFPKNEGPAITPP